MLAGYMRRYSLLTGLILFSFVAFAEPPNTVWKMEGPANNKVTITEVVESGTPWKFTFSIYSWLNSYEAGSSTKLNFRTIDLPDGYEIKTTTTFFKGNPTIEEIYWPDTVTEIPANGFLNCSKLKICDFPEGSKLEKIGSTAFQGVNLTRFRMSDSITSIGQDAFYQNKNLVFDGPMLPNSYTKIEARRFSSINGKPLKDGLLVVGGAGKPVTWVPYNDKNNNNKYFTGLNITNLIFGAEVDNAGTNCYENLTKYNPYGQSSLGSSITNIVVQNQGVFTFGDVLTYSPAPTTVRNYGVAGWITGTLVAHSTARKTRINAAKNKYWQEFLRTVTPADYKPWNEISDTEKAEYWNNFNGGVEGTGDEVPHGVVLNQTSYTITVDGETMLPLTIPADVWIVFNNGGEWSETVIVSVKVPVAVNGLTYTGSEQMGVPEGEGYTLEGHKATDAGFYTAIATLKDGYKWSDGSSEPKSITWSIAEKESEIEPDPLPDPEPDTGDTPASIIYVNPAATGLNNGTSWANAYTDFLTALKAITAEKNVIWLAGTFTCSADCVVTIPSGVEAKIRGGFKGTEATAADREAGVKSVVSGAIHTYKTLEVSSDSALRIERVRFVDSKDRGIYKTGEGDLTLVDCDIVGCGLSLGNVLGRGLYMTGTAEKTRLFAERCTFSGNRYGGGEGTNKLGSGHGAALINLARATFDNCLFATNGLSIVSSPADNTSGLNFFKGSALYAENAPVTARGTRFVGNRGWCSQGSAPSSDCDLMGGTVRLENVTKESAFTNCLWLANQSTIALVVHENFGGGGEIFYNPGNTDAKCEVVNCTFAANLNDIWRNGSRGVNVRSGKVKILNSIFGCNVRTRVGENVGEDIYVADGAEVYASYSMFTPDKSGDKALYAAGPGTLTLGDGVIFDEPKFVSRVDEARYMLGNKFRANYYLSVALDYLINFNVHLRSVAGYYDAEQNKRIRSYNENSPALDAGDPKCDYSKEPYTSWGYHGRRVNMGFYGNTPEAAATRYKGFFVKVVGGESAPREEVEVIGKPDNNVPVEDIIVCDDSDKTVKIYRGNEVVWKWSAKTDRALPQGAGDIGSQFTAVTEAEIFEYKGKKVVATTSSYNAWAIIDIATTNAIAYGYSRQAGQNVSTAIMPHSIELLPGDIVAVASTYTYDQNAPETKYGCYFYHIAGDKATSYKDPAAQGATFFSIENPHGFYWDDKDKKLYVSSSEGLTRLSVTFNSEKNNFDIKEEAVFGIAQFGVKWGHDLAVVPGTRILAMTAYEMTLFFDMDKSEWLLDEIIWRMDQKGFDPHTDKVHFLATVPRAGVGDKGYHTDTIEVWTKENGFKEYLNVPGALFYKARWAGGVLDSITK